MPKTVRFHEIGGPEVLRIEEEPVKQPGQVEMRLKVQAVGLNRAESMFMRGQYVEPPKLPGGRGNGNRWDYLRVRLAFEATHTLPAFDGAY